MNEIEVKKTMRNIRRQVIKYGDLSNSHCGHEELLEQLFKQEERLMASIEKAISKAGSL